MVAAALLAGIAPETDAADNDLAEVFGEFSACAYRAYRELVYETEGFETYFRAINATPEISDLKIGSRPSSRTNSSGIEDLRAIPWVFSWSQARTMLPGWYGFGAAATHSELRARRRSFPNCTAVAIFPDASYQISKWSLLSPIWRSASATPNWLRIRHSPDAFSRGFRRNGRPRTDAVLTLTGQKSLLESNPALSESIRLRLPYIDALNLLQLDLLRRRRRAPMMKRHCAAFTCR